MAKDIEPVDQGKATVAARLCNFKTAHSEILPAHRDWLKANVIPAIRNSPNPWVDVFGYASHLGDTAFNKTLSDKRCAAVVGYIRDSVSQVSFPQQFGYGESRSGGGVNDNDGYWRAVDLYVYASGKPSVPERPKPIPPTPEVVDDWFVTEFSGSSESVIIVLGYSAMTGHITFQRADNTKYRGSIGLFGLSAGVSYDPLSQSSLKAALARFPKLAQFLGMGKPMGNDLLLWAIQPGILQRVIANAPGGMRLFKVLTDVIVGGSTAPEWMPSSAIGMVFPFKPPLSTLSFYGSCLCYAASGTAAIANFG
jgi:hypothetical protein